VIVHCIAKALFASEVTQKIPKAIAPGPNPSIYSFLNVFHRSNLYRIPIDSQRRPEARFGDILGDFFESKLAGPECPTDCRINDDWERTLECGSVDREFRDQKQP
jgi:hypothetical protein